MSSHTRKRFKQGKINFELIWHIEIRLKEQDNHIASKQPVSAGSESRGIQEHLTLGTLNFSLVKMKGQTPTKT